MGLSTWRIFTMPLLYLLASRDFMVLCYELL